MLRFSRFYHGKRKLTSEVGARTKQRIYFLDILRPLVVDGITPSPLHAVLCYRDIWERNMSQEDLL